MSVPRKRATVRLSDGDGNSFVILGTCVQAAKRAGYTPEQIAEFKAEALEGDYDHLLQTAMKWFEVE